MCPSIELHELGVSHTTAKFSLSLLLPPPNFPLLSLGEYRIFCENFFSLLMLLVNGKRQPYSRFQLFSHVPSPRGPFPMAGSTMPQRGLNLASALFTNTTDMSLGARNTLDHFPAQHLMWKGGRKNPSHPWLKIISEAGGKAKVMPAISWNSW